MAFSFDSSIRYTTLAPPSTPLALVEIETVAVSLSEIVAVADAVLIVTLAGAFDIVAVSVSVTSSKSSSITDTVKAPELAPFGTAIEELIAL